MSDAWDMNWKSVEHLGQGDLVFLGTFKPADREWIVNGYGIAIGGCKLLVGGGGRCEILSLPAQWKVVVVIESDGG